MRQSLLLGLCFFFIFSNAQMGGSASFAFTLIENSALHTALGGVSIANGGDDPSMAYQNPSLLSPDMDNGISLSYANYFLDINHGFLSYAKNFDSIGTFGLSVGYFDYGEFVRTNANGEILDDVFDASDYTFQLSYARALTDRISVGVNTKFLYSVYEAYVSTGGAIDLGANYRNETQGLTAGFLVKNMGYQFLTYSNEGFREPLPFDVQFAMSKKLEHNPLRITVTAHNLHKWNNSYVNTNSRSKQIDLETGEVLNQNLSFGSKLMRHVIVSPELVFSDNFQLRFGYNHQRRVELSPENRRAMTGFSWGFGIGLKKFYLSYGRAGYYPGVSTHYFSVYSDLSSFKKRVEK